ncbi:hypothetical protein [Aeromonas veronii]|uniref:hypothetical protein n=1 Tax=Aeromonas veronii TaxID=654 RepID=UPI0027DB2926|nr:hypothetical protein [Aeromonas veronii]WMJ06532.1 hypothetical protein RBH93_08180 [Aeromonas veronii]
MRSNCVPELIAVGQELQALLESGDVKTAELLIDHYLELFNEVFQSAKSGLTIDTEQQQAQALLQFQSLYGQVENTKHQTEAALLKFSKAGRASDLYKLNLG